MLLIIYDNDYRQIKLIFFFIVEAKISSTIRQYESQNPVLYIAQLGFGIRH